MNYMIKITDPQDNVGNPLANLEGKVYATYEDACEAICEALSSRICKTPTGLWHGIDSFDSSQIEDYKSRTAYAKALRAYINHGIIEYDGVRAEVVEV